MVTTRRVRHGIVLALAGILAGLGLVAALFWDDGAGQRGRSAIFGQPPSPMAPDSTPDTAGKAAPPGRAGDRSGTEPQEGAGQGVDKSAEKAAAPADAPRFDIVRVEPNGDAVVAGRGKPNTVVEMLVDGKPVAKALTDPNGQFAIVPPPLPPGSSEIVLRSKSADGQETRSPQSVAVSLSPKGDSRPLVALTAPDAPTVVLSQPGVPPARPGEAGSGVAEGARPGLSPVPGTGTARIVSVDAQPGGRLFVTAAGVPDTQVQLYLNDTPIAPAKVGTDGRVTFTIGRGVSPGRYQVRIDQLDPASGKVASRAEVPFAMPEAVASGDPPRPASDDGERRAGNEAPQEGAPPRGDTTRAEAGAERFAATGDTTPRTQAPARTGGTGAFAGADAAAPQPGAVFVPEIATARINRGDSLWQISKRTYGRGMRYTVIYDANQAQIRDPDLIYPGQIFVLPNERRG